MKVAPRNNTAYHDTSEFDFLLLDKTVGSCYNNTIIDILKKGTNTRQKM